MPVGRRDVYAKRGKGKNKEALSPYSRKRKSSEESDTESKSESDSNTSINEDQTDATTHAHTPHAHKHTSGHTECIKRQSLSPRGKTPKHAHTQDVDAHTKTRTRKHQSTKRMILILIVFLLVVGLFSLYRSVKLKQEMEKVKRDPKSITEVYADLKIELKRLNREFSQPREVWIGLLSQFEAMMVDRPTQPATLLFVVPQDSKLSAVCLAHQLANSIQLAFEDSGFITFDPGSSGNRGDGAALKMELDEALQRLRETHTAVVHSVDNLPGSAAMILHGYCDNENAPFKQAVIILLVDIPMKYSEVAYSRLDAVVDSHLTDLWGRELKEKDVSALISRTSNTPVLIRPEEISRMMELCPL